jgi:hypothetical protein
MQAHLRPDPARGAGYGIIDLEGFEEQDADVLFSLRRASDGKYLGSGDWLEAEQRLAPDMAQLRGDTLRLLVGPGVVDMLDALDSFAITAYPAAGDGRRYRLDVGDPAYSVLEGGQGVSRQVAGGMLPTPGGMLPAPVLSAPGRRPPLAPLPRPAQQPEASEPASGLPAPSPVPQAGPAPPLPMLKDPVEPGRKMPLLPLLLVLVCAAGVLYWRQPEDAPPAARDAPAASSAKSAAPAASPAQSHLQRAREVLRRGAAPEEALELAKGMQTPEGADGAFLLLEDAAQRGKPEAMLLLARFYDPTDGTPRGSIMADPEQARDWYRKAKERGHEAADGRLKRLRAWAEAERDRNPQARKALENWQD